MIDRMMIISRTLLFFGYIFAITTTGVIQSKIARRLGDSTGEDNGFSEFNPFTHVYLIDVIFFLLIRFMIGAMIPINISSIRGPRRIPKLVLVFTCRAFVYLLIAITSLVCLHVFTSYVPITVVGERAVFDLARTQGSAFGVVLSLFFTVLAGSTIVLGALSGIRDAVYGAVLYKFEQDPRFLEYIPMIMMFGVLVLFIFFGSALAAAFGYVANAAASGILALFRL